MIRSSLALRLTLWYGAVFTLSSLLAFAVVYLLMASIVQQRTDDDLEGDIEEFAALLESEGLESVLDELMAESQAEDAGQVYVRLWDGGDKLVFSSNLESWSGLEGGNIPPE